MSHPEADVVDYAATKSAWLGEASCDPVCLPLSVETTPVGIGYRTVRDCPTYIIAGKESWPALHEEIAADKSYWPNANTKDEELRVRA